MYKSLSRFSTKVFLIFTLSLSTQISLYGQDGSDIRFFKTNGVDNSLIGQYVHFDFFRRSFGRRAVDTATINISDKDIRFVEIRNDNGYNNWFSQQYLQSLDTIEEQTIRISKFKLDSITKTSFYVTMYLDFYDIDNNFIGGKSRQIEYWFNKKDIVEVLVSSEQL